MEENNEILNDSLEENFEDCENNVDLDSKDSETIHDDIEMVSSDDEQDESICEEISEECKEICVDQLVDIRHILKVDDSLYSYISKYADTFIIESVPIKDKSKILDIINNECYVSTITSYIYDDIIFGFKEFLDSEYVKYTVYSSEYSFEFSVPVIHKKDENMSMKDYINGLIKVYPIRNVKYCPYSDKITINDFSVELYGLMNISSDIGEYSCILKEEFGFISFYSILLYFREMLDDIDEDKDAVIKTGCIKKFFDLF